MFLGKFHNLSGMVTVIGLVWSAVVVIALGEDEDIIAATEWIFEDGSWPQVDVGVATWSLVGGRTIKVPDSQLADVGHFLVDSLRRWLGDASAGSGSESLTHVFERRPPLPSTQTSTYNGQLGRVEDKQEERPNIHSAWILSPWGRARYGAKRSGR